MRCRGVYLLSPLVLAASVSASDRGYRPPRLDDGQVDLQGMWAHTNLTPFERPPEFDTFVIGAEQAAQIKATIDARNDDLSRPAEPSLYFDSRFVEAVRGELRSSIIIEPSNGLIPGNAFFKEQIGQARSAVLTAFDGPEQRPASERCLSAPSAGPPVLLVPASDLRQIVQTRDAIVMAAEELHEARIVRMNATHAPAAVVSWLGDSVGRWDGDTLVVETTSFAPTSALRAGPNGMLLLSPQAIVVERITRISDTELLYEFAVTDPTYYTQTWKGETRLHKSLAQQFEYACHEGNYSLAYSLLGARAQEVQEESKQTLQAQK